MKPQTKIELTIGLVTLFVVTGIFGSDDAEQAQLAHDMAMHQREGVKALASEQKTTEVFQRLTQDGTYMTGMSAK